DLDEALPALEVAVQCLKSLKLSHIQEVKALANPPGGVKLTLEAICIMFEVKPTMKNDPERPGKKITDYWESAKSQVLSDPKGLLEKLFAFDKDNIPEKVITNIEPYIGREDFDPAVIKKASVACEVRLYCGVVTSLGTKIYVELT
ncbi:dynein heavy chain, putative, partial [Perkinsus marinus ATCC 50983]